MQTCRGTLPCLRLASGSRHLRWQRYGSDARRPGHITFTLSTRTSHLRVLTDFTYERRSKGGLIVGMEFEQRQCQMGALKKRR